MREIKFKFVYSNNKDFIAKIFDLVDIINGEPFDVLSDMPMYKDYKIVGEYQYTGLKDKNGVEIYEDDLINIGGRNYRVIYQDAGFRVGRSKLSKTLGLCYAILKGVVVGNAHQNPEFLESEL